MNKLLKRFFLMPLLFILQGVLSLIQAETLCPPVLNAPTQAEVETAQAKAKDRGFLWRVTKEGRTSYLYGTIHVGKLDWAFPGPVLRKALATTDTLALELDITDPAVIQSIQERLGKKRMSLSKSQRARLEKQYAQMCVDPADIAQDHPLMQVMTLTLISARFDGLETAFAQEAILAANLKGKQKIVSLETAQRQITALIPSNKKEAEASFNHGMEQLETGKARRLWKHMATLWEQGNLEELSAYEEWCECMNTPEDRKYMKSVNDDRNPEIAKAIDRLHSAGHAVFAAVGALHMTGPAALPLLMEKKGYVVERVNYSQP